jgi:hypothetical protein
VLIAILVGSQAPAADVPKGQPAATPAAKATEIHVGRAKDCFSWSMAGAGSWGWGGDIHRMEGYLAESDRAALMLDEESNMDAVSRLIRHFAITHGRWVKAALERRDPAERFQKYEATLRLPKQEFSTDEPIPLVLEIRPKEPPKEDDFVPDAPWWLFSPTHLKVEDDRGREINLFTQPVSTQTGGIRSKVFYGLKEKTIDLASFVVPYYGIEFVRRWEPGAYRVTYYFYADLDEASEPVDFMRPHAFASQSSNTVTFTVKKAEGGKPPDTAAMMAAAAGLVEKNLANDAAEAYKRVVLASRDQATIQQAIRQVLLIRSRVSFDEEEYRLKDGQRLADLMSKDINEDWIRGYSLELSLLHLAPAECRAWVARYLKIHRVQEGMDTPDMTEAEADKEGAFWGEARLEWLFLFPPFKPMLDEALQHPDTCPSYYIGVYLVQVEPKDPAIMKAFLARAGLDPIQVLLYYQGHKAPLELVPFIQRHFDDAGIPDLAMQVFEKAVGLNLGFIDNGTSRPRRGDSHDAVRALLDKWWHWHARDYGVTPGADDALILKRMAAIRVSDEVWECRIDRVGREDGRTVLHLSRLRTIRGDYAPGNSTVFVSDGAGVAESLLKPKAEIILCVSRTARSGDFLLNRPDAVWPAETEK